MFTQSLIAFVALAGYIATPVLAVPGASWVRRQEDAQTSRTLDPAVISEGLKQDGQGDNPDPAQVRSATSSNNFINHCLIALDQGVPLTNGQQIATGSCSQTPMGRIVSLDVAPRSKFVFPKNGDESLVENQAFTVQMKILNLVTGNFVNAQTNYYSAPQQVNDQGILVGHSHVTIQNIPDLQTTEPVDPTRFAFFKGFNDAAQGDILSATVTNGLPAGVYRMCSINTAANHQVALVSNAQHGALEDCSYFTVKAAGQTNNNNNNNNSSTSASNSNTATATVSQSASATDSSSASATATESASVSNGADDSSSSASESSTEAPSATESAAPEQSSSAQESDSASQEQPSATFSESSAAPEPTDNGNNNNNGDNGNNNNNNGDNGNNNNGNNGNGDQGQNNGNTDGNNNNNNGNQGNNDQNNGNNGNNDNNNNNNQGNNDQNNGNNGESSSAEPAPTENTGAQDPAAAPSADSSSEAPAPEATPTPENGNNGNNGNGDNQNNGDNGAQTPGGDNNVPTDPAADTNNQGGDNQGNNGQN